MWPTPPNIWQAVSQAPRPASEASAFARRTDAAASRPRWSRRQAAAHRALRAPTSWTWASAAMCCTAWKVPTGDAELPALLHVLRLRRRGRPGPRPRGRRRAGAWRPARPAPGARCRPGPARWRRPGRCGPRRGCGRRWAPRRTAGPASRPPSTTATTRSAPHASAARVPSRAATVRSGASGQSSRATAAPTNGAPERVAASSSAHTTSSNVPAPSARRESSPLSRERDPRPVGVAGRGELLDGGGSEVGGHGRGQLAQCLLGVAERGAHVSPSSSGAGRAAPARGP